MASFDRLVFEEQALKDSFTSFFDEVEPRIRRALCVAFGIDSGTEAAAEALSYAWEHWDRVRTMANPAGYVYKVGRSKARPRRPARPQLPPVSADSSSWVEPGLPQALSRLSESQRIAVWLIHGYEWTLAETV